MFRIGMMAAGLWLAWQVGAWGQAAGPAEAPAPRKASPPAVERWRDWRFGMFIHWGPVSLTEKEISWSRANSNPTCPNNGPTPVAVYDNLYTNWNPAKFNAKEWVATAQAAGMKYMVLTVKHCDGFLLWDSKVSDYNIMHTPLRRDVARELADACHQAGMGLGWYFSPMDWKDPDCRQAKNAEFVKRNQAELAELLSNYGKIDILWFDTDGRPALWDQQNTYALIRRLQPDILIDERLDLGGGGWNAGHIGPWADFHTPEQFVGGFDLRPWESCMTVSAHNQWAWGGHQDGVKTFAQCMDMLIRCAGANGNMLLNIGPMPDGAIAPEQTERIKEMGAWLKRYGESIYGTRGGPCKPARQMVSTRRGKTIYLHLLDGSGDSFEIRDLPAKVVRARVLNGGHVAVAQSNGCLTVSLLAADHQKPDTIVALELDRDAMSMEPMKVQLPSQALSAGKPVTASSIYNNDPQYGPGQAVDDSLETRWASDVNARSGWLEVDLGAEREIGSVRLSEIEWPETREFTVEIKQDDAWKEIARGTTIGPEKKMAFAPVKARHVRLHIQKAALAININEFQVFPPEKKP